METLSNAEISKDERNWAMVMHLSSFSGYLIPFGNILGPLICWMIKRQELPFADAHGKESLNFQISMTIYFFVALLLMLVFIGFILAVALAIFHIVAVIIATIRANEGQKYEYPLTIRFFK